MSGIKKLTHRIHNTLFRQLPKEHLPDFKHELLVDNYSRLSVIAVVMFFIEAVLLPLEEQLVHQYIMVSFLLVSLILVPIIIYIGRHINKVRTFLAMTVMNIYALTVLLYGAILALSSIQQADLTHVYMMAVLSVSMFLYFRPLPLALLYTPVYVGFALALPYFGATPEEMLAIRVNAFVFNFFAWILGQMTLRNRMSVFEEHLQLSEQNRILEDLAQRDAMTGLFHHSASLGLLEDEIEHARCTGCPLTLIMIDVDDFKSINDTYGHQYGDEVICNTAAILSSAVGNNGIVGRYGGEEFIIILPGADLNDALYTVTTIQSDFEKTFSQPRVTFSGGVSLYQGESLNELVRLTDERLYEAKSKGKCRFVSTKGPLFTNTIYARR